MNVPEMIQEIMDKTGWKQAEVGSKFGVEQATVSRWLKGADPRGTTRDAIRALHQMVTTAQDIDSMDVAATLPDTEQRPRMIPVVSYVGAGDEILGIDDALKGGGIDEIEAPPGASRNAIALRVRGGSMYPAYNDGDYIIYDERLNGDAIDIYIGKECVVGLADGRMFVKTLLRGGHPKTWTLLSYNAPPMQDVIVEWAARVRWIERA